MIKDLKDLFVPYTQALELKELGFDEPCFGRYYYKESYPMLNPQSGQTELVFEFGQYLKHTEVTILAPTFSQCFRWFREEYHLLGCPQYFTGGYYCYTINDMKDTKESNRLFTEFSSFKEAEMACLEKLIEIVKTK